MSPHSPRNRSEASDQFVKQAQPASRTNLAVSSAVRLRSLPRSLRERVNLTVGFTRAAGLVKELPPQEQLQARVTADFERR